VKKSLREEFGKHAGAIIIKLKNRQPPSDDEHCADDIISDTGVCDPPCECQAA
jgi:hypothetical protein